MKRFWDKVNKTDNCWEWTGAIRQGYGCLKIDGKTIDAHRYSYVIHFGPIPDGMCILHKCDNRKCVKPDHLFLGTYADNHKDMCNKKRDAYRQTWVTIRCLNCDKIFYRQLHRFNSSVKDGHLSIACSIQCGNKLYWQIKHGTNVDIEKLQKEAIVKIEQRYRV